MPEYEKMSSPRRGSGNIGSDLMIFSWSESRGLNSKTGGWSKQKRSSAAPGPREVHGSARSFETLSYALPMDSSGVVASVLNEVGERARRRRVCPPEMSRVRKGKVGMSDRGRVRKGVSA